MNLHLIEVSKAVMLGVHAALVLDRAGWHVSDKPIIPDNIILVKLPPCVPEIDRIEDMWAYLRSTKLTRRLFDTHKDAVDACCEAWGNFVVDKKTVRPTTTRQ